MFGEPSSTHGDIFLVMLSFGEHTLSIGEYQTIVPWDLDVLVHDGRAICKERPNLDLVKDIHLLGIMRIL